MNIQEEKRKRLKELELIDRLDPDKVKCNICYKWIDKKDMGEFCCSYCMEFMDAQNDDSSNRRTY